MAAKNTNQEVVALSDAQLVTELSKINIELGIIGPAIRSRQSNEYTKYRQLKKKRAQIATEKRSRELSTTTKSKAKTESEANQPTN